MTQKDAMDGGTDPLYVDPDLFDGGGAREHSPSAMRKIAEELRTAISALEGSGSAEGYTTGSVNAILDHCQLTEAQIGTWHDASAFASTVGKNSGAQKFADVYKQYIQALKDVATAIEANAANHGAADVATEGGK
ncbi:hypothetical protein [Nonomuraea rhodomycinica]|uniref:Excreted virulence factor EspC, type VII ESX diderm n=1 Tax=Nonomuraea rhodomycinica TaxID=1712872 RepID=A0A7Y6IML2_9ACTN|nr:hypothetical protein [Nonomuraea rhodomycinica]NUW40962.1 hypothetical protein [Nonomuraea rhodomycinica]